MNSNPIKVNVQIRDGREDTYDAMIGSYWMLAIPRTEEVIWLPHEVGGYSSWEVIDVCHWAASGEVCLYVVPVTSDEPTGD